MEFLRLFRSRKVQAQTTTFFSLPSEIRQQIYILYCSNAYIRYRRTAQPTLTKHPPEWTKTAVITGPHEHALLATCHAIRSEAISSLEDAAYLLLDRTDPAIALDVLARQNVDMPPFLVKLVQRVRRIVVSKPHVAIRQERTNLIIPLKAPYFENVDTVEMFGFYPMLQWWLQRDRAISKGWGMWHWQIFLWRSTSRPTGSPRVELSREGQWWVRKIQQGRKDEHNRLKEDYIQKYLNGHPDAVVSPRSWNPAFSFAWNLCHKTPTVLLRAWGLERAGTSAQANDCYHVLVDVATKEVLGQERIAFHKAFDRCGHFLEMEIEENHDFLRATQRRRAAWLAEDMKSKMRLQLQEGFNEDVPTE